VQQLRNWGSSIPEWDQYAAAAGARRGVHRIEDKIGAVPGSDRNCDRGRCWVRTVTVAVARVGAGRGRGCDSPSPVALDPTADLDRNRRPGGVAREGEGEIPARPDSTPTAIRRHDADSTAPSWSNPRPRFDRNRNPSGPV